MALITAHLNAGGNFRGRGSKGANVPFIVSPGHNHKDCVHKPQLFN